MIPRPLLVVLVSFFAVAQAHAQSFQSWAARGAREEREKDPKAAAASYSNALSLWENGDGNAAKAKVLCARANLREKDGDEAGALSDLSDCLAIDKKNTKGFHRRGVMRLKAGKTPEAISDFYRAIALDIRFAQAYADRAAAYERQRELIFAREDHLHACRLGIKASCARAKALAPPAKGKNASPKAPAGTAAPESDDPESAPSPAPAPEPQAQRKPAAATTPSYRPRFRDCRAALDACVEKGDSFGECVRRAPDCGSKPVRGCCPAACLKAFQKTLNRDGSEAEAYREHFKADASCALPPKEEEE